MGILNFNSSAREGSKARNAHRKQVREQEKVRLERSERILGEFNRRASRAVTSAMRIRLLKSLSRRVIVRQCPSTYWVKRIREEFEVAKRGIVKLPALCWACERMAQVRHHVIQIQNGGLNINRNIVPLCCDCHAEVHPWLKTTSK